MKTKLTKSELCWSLYDVANSAYVLMITAMIPPFIASIGNMMGFDGAQTTAHWSFVQSGSTMAVALLAPILGAMADYKGKKKLFFTSFFTLAVIMFLAMAFVDNYYVLLAIDIFAGIGYAGSNIFYDAFLIDVTEDERMDYISSFGYAAGYIGSCVPFVVSILLYTFKPFGMSALTSVRIGIIINALWWIVFTVPFFRHVKQKYYTENNEGNIIKTSFKRVFKTTKLIFKDKTIGLFLLSYFFYIDGVDTIIKLSTSYGQALGLNTTSMIIALLVTQIVAFPAVLIFAKVASRFSPKKVILASIGAYVGITIFGFFLEHEWQFWLLAIAIGLVQGTIQALSRSYFGRLIPKENNNEYFGFYNIFGKYATVVGPLLMGIFTTLTKDPRYGVLSITLLFIAGFITFIFVPDVKNAD